MPIQLSGSGNVVKGSIFKVSNEELSDQYVFKMNFSELNSSVSAEYNFLSPPGSIVPTAVYKATNGKEISFTILADYTEKRTDTGAIPDISFFESLALPDIPLFLESQARWIAPPRLLLVLGDRSWDVVCTSVTFKETMYNRNMIPIRVYIDVSFRTIFVSQEETWGRMNEIITDYEERVIL